MNRATANAAAGLEGLITESHFEQAEEQFPGITRFYSECPAKPTTFLELVWLFQNRERSAA